MALVAAPLALACSDKKVVQKKRPAEEKRLTILAAYEAPLMEALLEAYLKYRPTDEVTTRRLSVKELEAKVAAGGRGDLIVGLPASSLERLRTKGVLRSHPAKTCDDVGARYRARDSSWIGLTIRAIALGINERLLDRRRLTQPDEWEDLTSSKYRGWVVLGHPKRSEAASLFLRSFVGWKHPVGWNLWKRIDRNVFQYVGGRGQPTKMVETGQSIIAVDFDRYLLAARRKKKGIRIVYPKPVPYVVEGMAIPKTARFKKAAARAMRWLCSKTGLEALEPFRTGVGNPYVEPTLRWKKRFTQVKLLHPSKKTPIEEEFFKEWERRMGK